MKGFVLAAGVGSRLRPLTEHLPKPLLPVAGIPILFFALALLRRAGIREVGMNLHYRAEKIPELLGDGSRMGFSLRYFHEEKLLGTGGAIRNAADFLKDADFFLLNGDTILDVDPAALGAAHREGGGIATLAISTRQSLERFGGISFGGNGKVKGIIEAGGIPLKGEEAAVFAGLSALRPEILEFLDRAGEAPCILRQGVFPAIRQGCEVSVFRVPGYFADIGTLDRYREADLALSAGKEAAGLRQEAATLYEVATSTGWKSRSQSPV